MVFNSNFLPCIFKAIIRDSSQKYESPISAVVSYVLRGPVDQCILFQTISRFPPFPIPECAIFLLQVKIAHGHIKVQTKVLNYKFNINVKMILWSNCITVFV